jgi:hypothetical protein
MTEHIEQTSASDRLEAARKALTGWEALDRDCTGDSRPWRPGDALADALRALITPPGFPLTQVSIDHAADIAEAHGYDSNGVTEAVMEGIEYGIQCAHERWEPADRPTQEQMLRWLGIDYARSDDGELLIILSDTIDREDD